MSTRRLTVTFTDGTEEPLHVPPGAPGDRETNFSFRGSAFSGPPRWSEAQQEAIARIEGVTGKSVASLGD